MIEITLPSLGEGVEKGTVVSVLVKKGDSVTIDQPLMEVETDKVTAEVPSEFAGKIMEVLVKVGDEIPEGKPILKMEKNGASDNTEGMPVSQVKSGSNKMPEPKTEAAVAETKHSDLPQTASKIVSSPVKIVNEKRGIGMLRASPLAKKIAREIGVDISAIKSGRPSGRISVADVKLYAKEALQNPASNGHIAKVATLPNFEKWGTIKKGGMSGIAQATAKNMSNAWSQIPHAWLQEKADITVIENKRKKYKTSVKDQGGGLTITAILVKALSKTLLEFPIFNASVDVGRNEIIYKDYVNIGVAVDTPKGLVVPVIRGSAEKSLTQISIELTEVSVKARENKLKIDDLQGATFTISNLGGIGTTGIFPIVNFPQSAILGVSASKIEPQWKEESFQPRLMMPMTVGFDHRIINGADAARFLRYTKEILEDWFVMSL